MRSTRVNPLRVFISYVTKPDLETATTLKVALYEAAREVQLPVHIYVARDEPRLFDSRHAGHIIDNLIGTDALIVLWTEKSRTRAWVRFECLLGYGLGKPTTLAVGPDVHRTMRETKDVTHFNIPANPRSRYQWRAYAATLIAELRDMCLTGIGVAGPHSQVEDDFYQFAIDEIRNNPRNMILLAGTPALLLPAEAYSFNREAYVDCLLGRMSDSRYLSNSYYLFSLGSTRRSLPRDTQGLLKERLRTLARVLERTSAHVYGLPRKNPAIPSAIIGEHHGALILRKPGTREFLEVRFVAGSQLHYLRERIYQPLVQRDVAVEQEWYSDIKSSVYSRRT
jgi:hypothetical protein